MQVKELSDCVDVDQIENALRTVPESLEATYTKVLCQIPKRNREKARFMLLLIAYSFEPLSLEEVAAVAFLPEPNDVLNVCTSTFLSTLIDDNDSMRPKTVRLDHFSVKEYLISTSIQESTASYFYKSEQLAHLILGEAMVSFLIRTLDKEPDKHPDWHPDLAYSIPFLKYSINYWFRHARKGQPRELHLLPAEDIRSSSKALTIVAERESLEGRTHRLFRVELSAAYAAWAATWDQLRYTVISDYPNRRITLKEPILRSSFPPLSCASFLGLKSHVERLLDDGADIDARSYFLSCTKLKLRGISLTALQLAACDGHLDVLSKLLGKGAAITQKDLELIAAIGRTNLDEVLQLLLSEKQTNLVIDGPLIISMLSNSCASRPGALAFLLSTSDNIEIGRATIVEAINCSVTRDVLLLLLTYCKGSIELDGACAILKTEPTPAQVKLLFKCPKIVAGIEERCSIYRMSLKKAARFGSKDSEYISLLSEFGLDIGAKELRQVVQSQASNIAVSEALLMHVGYHIIDEGLLLAAARNMEVEGRDLMRFLLKHLQRDLVITQQFLEDVTASGGTVTPVLIEYVLQHKSDEVQVTESAIVAAVENSTSRVFKEMVGLLVNTTGQKPELGPAMIKAVMRRHMDMRCVDALETVLELMGPKVMISEELIRLAGDVFVYFRNGTRNCTDVLQEYKSKQAVELMDDDA